MNAAVTRFQALFIQVVFALCFSIESHELSSSKVSRTKNFFERIFHDFHQVARTFANTGAAMISWRQISRKRDQDSKAK